MLSDDELIRLRQAYVDAVILPARDTDDRAASWNDLVCDPRSETIKGFLDDPVAPASVKVALKGVVTAIGLACAGAVLEGAPLPLDRIKQRAAHANPQRTMDMHRAFGTEPPMP